MHHLPCGALAPTVCQTLTMLGTLGLLTSPLINFAHSRKPHRQARKGDVLKRVSLATVLITRRTPFMEAEKSTASFSIVPTTSRLRYLTLPFINSSPLTAFRALQR